MSLDFLKKTKDLAAALESRAPEDRIGAVIPYGHFRMAKLMAVTWPYAKISYLWFNSIATARLAAATVKFVLLPPADRLDLTLADVFEPEDIGIIKKNQAATLAQLQGRDLSLYQSNEVLNVTISRYIKTAVSTALGVREGVEDEPRKR